MSQNTAIEWADHTFNPWIGCTKVSPGCANCYAAVTTPARVDRANGIERWGKGNPRRRTSTAMWNEPLIWNQRAKETGVRARVFPSLCDPFDDEVPIQWFCDLLELIQSTPHLDWLLLTKRPERWEERIQDAYMHSHGEGWQSMWTQGEPPENVWLGVSVEDQQRADERIPALLQIPAKVRFLSVEPMLEKVRLWSEGFIPADEEGPKRVGYMRGRDDGKSGLLVTPAEVMEGIHWVIVGGESGTSARPCDVEWIRSIVIQCKDAGLSIFVKQLGAYPIARKVDCDDWPEHVQFDQACVGITIKLRHPKGGEITEWPTALAVRQFPAFNS